MCQIGVIGTMEAANVCQIGVIVTMEAANVSNWSYSNHGSSKCVELELL